MRSNNFVVCAHDFVMVRADDGVARVRTDHGNGGVLGVVPRGLPSGRWCVHPLRRNLTVGHHWDVRRYRGRPERYRGPRERAKDTPDPAKERIRAGSPESANVRHATSRRYERGVRQNLIGVCLMVGVLAPVNSSRPSADTCACACPRHQSATCQDIRDTRHSPGPSRWRICNTACPRTS